MTVEVILAGVVGLAVGVLVALWVDEQRLVRRVLEAKADKQKAEANLQKFHIRHRAAEQQLQVTQADLATAVQERTQYEELIAKQLAEVEASREQLQTSLETNEMLKENLQEVQERLEELEGLQLISDDKLETAVTQNNDLLGDLQLMEAEIVTLEAKVDQLTGELEQIQSHATGLEQRVVTAEAQLTAVESEKDIALTQLQQAELSSVEKKAEIEALQQRLEEANSVHQSLVVTQEKLQTADAHIKKLKGTLDDVQTKMSYSGKNQLQLIRGIGPTYARRLSEFGIQTFADLADCNPEQIASIIKKKNWQSVDIEKWLEEAKALAARFGPDA